MEADRQPRTSFFDVQMVMISKCFNDIFQGGGRVSKFGTMCPTFHGSLRVSVFVWVLSIFVLVRL